MLEAVGVSELEEYVYRALLGVPAASIAKLARHLNLRASDVESALEGLEAKGMVGRTTRRGAGYLAVPPDVAVEALMAQREAQLHTVRATVAQLVAEYRAGRAERHLAELVEIVVGTKAVAQRFEQLQRGAREEVLILARPPYVVPADSNDAEIEALRRGVSVRTLYDRAALDAHGDLSVIRRYVNAGEQARIIAQLPMKLAVVDRSAALLPLVGDEAVSGAVLVHPSALLDSLVALFEALWGLGSALAWAGTVGALPVDGDRLILSMLHAGMTDEAMAKQLGTSARTVQRRIRVVMDSLGANTRFQLGFLAAERGWLT